MKRYRAMKGGMPGTRGIGLTSNRAPAAQERMRVLQAKRNALANDDPQQNVLGPKEHGAYAELRVRRRPVLGTLEQMALIPAYTMAKHAGLMSGRSDPSVDEMAEGYRGVGRGVMANLGDLFMGDPVAAPSGVEPITQIIAREAAARGMDPEQAVAEWIRRRAM